MIWIAGPCVIESLELCERVLMFCQSLAKTYGLQYVFKASFDKANRTSVNSFRGPGLEEGLQILQRLKQTYGVQVTTDVHEVHQIAKVAEVADILQIPAFLCRQTDLLVAAGETGRIVNVKKGQFMDPENMQFVVDKVRAKNPEAEVWLSERGTTFGYQSLVVDYCGIASMLKLGVPVIFDATHSVQRPGGGHEKTQGAAEFIPQLGSAAIATGVSGLFTEVHPEPPKALSDGQNSLSFESTEATLKQWAQLWRFLKEQN